MEKEKLKSNVDLDFIKIVEDQKPENFEDSDFVFFCKDCKEIVEAESFISRWKKINKCKKCWWEKVVAWFENTIKKFYKI